MTEIRLSFSRQLTDEEINLIRLIWWMMISPSIYPSPIINENDLGGHEVIISYSHPNMEALNDAMVHPEHRAWRDEVYEANRSSGRVRTAIRLLGKPGKKELDLRLAKLFREAHIRFTH